MFPCYRTEIACNFAFSWWFSVPPVLRSLMEDFPPSMEFLLLNVIVPITTAYDDQLITRWNMVINGKYYLEWEHSIRWHFPIPPSLPLYSSIAIFGIGVATIWTTQATYYVCWSTCAAVSMLVSQMPASHWHRSVHSTQMDCVECTWYVAFKCYAHCLGYHIDIFLVAFTWLSLLLEFSPRHLPSA